MSTSKEERVEMYANAVLVALEAGKTVKLAHQLQVGEKAMTGVNVVLLPCEATTDEQLAITRMLHDRGYEFVSFLYDRAPWVPEDDGNAWVGASRRNLDLSYVSDLARHLNGIYHICARRFAGIFTNEFSVAMRGDTRIDQATLLAELKELDERWYDIDRERGDKNAWNFIGYVKNIR